MLDGSIPPNKTVSYQRTRKMRFSKFFLFFILVISATARADKYASDYFKIGNWHLGQKVSALSKVEDFGNIRLSADETYSTHAITVFSENSDVKLFFKRGALLRTEITIYKGASYEEAIAATKALISHISSEFGGANLEGLTTSEGLKPDMVDSVISQLKTQSDKAANEINSKKPDKQMYYDMFFSISTEKLAKKNFIYGKFSYFGNSESYEIVVYEDAKFNSNHLYKTNIHIGAKKN